MTMRKTAENGVGMGRGELRRERLREVCRRLAGRERTGNPVELAAVQARLDRVAEATLDGWRAVVSLDPLALAEAGTREDLDELEFLVSRCLCELGGIRNVVVLARHLAS